MDTGLLVYACLLLWSTSRPLAATASMDLSAAMSFLERQNRDAETTNNRLVTSMWTYNTDITPQHQRQLVAEDLVEAEFTKQSGLNASTFAWQTFQNDTIRRRFSKVADIGTAAMPDKDRLERLKTVLSNMQTTYSTGRVCLTPGNCLELEPGLTRLMATSRDYTELTQAWKGWRDATGKKMKEEYSEFVALSNEAIRANGYDDTGAYWRSWYESPGFADDIEQLFQQLEPLYIELHAYTRRKLMEVYDPAFFPQSGHIPAHILGNMWAQSWNNLLDIMQPYKDRKSVDVTPQMKEKNFTARHMFEIADEFFASLGLIKMPQEFWDNSMIERPTDGRDVVCHASAWDFYNGKDFRIKMCTDITMESLITIHHEMGHIEYYLQYKDQPVVFRDGANPGFHEAIGDVLALSVATPKHLKKIGLLNETQDDSESTINFMMSMALDKIAFLPFGYLIDLWRWSVFRGETPLSMYNTKWWELRCRYQGISPPVPRSEDDFDPGAKYHIPANTPYIRYFVSFIIQFQFHKALCQTAGQTGPLHECDIYQSKEAGALLAQVLKMGSSRPWPEVMQMITGQDKMDVSALLEYFKPLTDWLKAKNEGHQKDWDDDCPLDIMDPLASHASSVCVTSFVLIIAIFLTIWQRGD